MDEDNQQVNVELDLSTNGRFGAQRQKLKPPSTAVSAPPTPLVPKVEPEAERPAPPTQVEGGASSAEREPPICHLPPQVEGVSFVNSASTAPPTSHSGGVSREAKSTTRIEREEAASQRPPRPPPCKRLRTDLNLSSRGSNLIPPPPAHSNQQMEAGGNNNDNAASRVPVLRQQQAPAAVGTMSGRQLSAGAGNVEARGRTMMPRVYARGRGGAGNGGDTTTVHGFLHRFDTVQAVSIICVCHGLCHTPRQFVEHAGGGAAERAQPLRHIVVVNAADYFAHQQTPSPSPSSSHRRPF